MTKEVIDLRSALELLESIPGQMVHTDVEMPLLQWSLIKRKLNARKSCIWLLTKALISVN